MPNSLLEPTTQPQRLQFKVAASEVEAPGTVEVRADEGIVEAIVSVTGIEDEVKDIIVPGAYTQTLAKRKPKVIWHHSWEQPIGRILHIEELKPGDSRLPHQTKDGQSWPQAAGGLLATMQFNLKSDRGREAFEAVRFYSESGECEWSIGYQVPPSASTRDKKGIRHIKAIDLYEISFVLFGAASQTGTLGVKAALAAAHMRMETKEATGEDPGPEVMDDDEALDTAVALAITDAFLTFTEDDWNELAGDEAALVAEAKAMTPGGRVGDDSPIGEPGGRQNWVDKAGGLPKYIRMVAHALIRKGMAESRAIATAVNTMKRWAAGGGNVSAKVQAAAVKAVAEWEAKKRAGDARKSAHVATEHKADEWNPWLEKGQYASVKQVSPTSFKDNPRVEGTYEQLLETVRSAVVDALMDTYTGTADKDDDHAGKWSHISIDGTWDDRVLATCIKWSDGGDQDKESYEMNYVIAEDGEVTLSEPVPVNLVMVAESVDGDMAADPEVPVGDLLPVPELVESAVAGAKALLFARGEVKAGRVLSSVNETRLKGALESLIAILRAAGIEVDAGPARDRGVLPAQVDMGTTAPSASPEGKVLLDPEQMRAELAALLNVDGS